MTKKMVISEHTKLIEMARSAFGQMQNSWWQFAKSIHAIKKEEAFKEAGYENFKFFCQGEYPTMNYVTIVKFMAIVDSMEEAIESRMKDETYRLPSYEACYTVVSVKSEIPKEEVSKLRKAVLDSKLSYLAIRDKLKELMSKRTKESRERMDTTVQDLERELTDDLSKDHLPSEDELYSGFDEEQEEEDDADGSDLALVKAKAEYLVDNLPDLQSSLLKVTDEVVEFAEVLEKLSGLINSYLDKVEEKSR